MYFINKMNVMNVMNVMSVMKNVGTRCFVRTECRTKTSLCSLSMSERDTSKSNQSSIVNRQDNNFNNSRYYEIKDPFPCKRIVNDKLCEHRGAEKYYCKHCKDFK